ncbi:GntR family transcriptional regulator [Actinotalea sp. C106]|uniref:GntR family transcriptional regulator n=1 Tax=Actinotalea sp. C106 TaxID=2908644 RepID=UPI002028448C|nr:GntR family transcriptional regulator [Actinotalea sp. C106]
MGTTTNAAPDSAPDPGAARLPRREKVYEALREELMAGRFSPWERLGEERLAEHFGVSRTPVREALARLHADGLLEKRAGGLYLYMPTFEDLTDLYELRITLELQGIRRAIDDPTVHHDAARLTTELESWQRMSDDEPAPSAGFVTVDEGFHTALLAASGNRALSASLAQVNQRIRAVRMYDYLTADRMRATIDEHIEIAELVLGGRLPTALEALADHVGASKDVVVERAANALAMARGQIGGQR